MKPLFAKIDRTKAVFEDSQVTYSSSEVTYSSLLVNYGGSDNQIGPAPMNDQILLAKPQNHSIETTKPSNGGII